MANCATCLNCTFSEYLEHRRGSFEAVCVCIVHMYFILFHNSSHHFASVCFLLQEFRTCNGAAIIISCLGGNLGTNLKTGIGSMVAISAGTDAWIWSALILLENTTYSKPSFVKVKTIFSNVLLLRSDVY